MAGTQRRRWIALAALAAIAAAAWWMFRSGGGGAYAELPQTAGSAMGTAWKLVLAEDASMRDLERAGDLVAAALREVEGESSGWLPGSDVSRLGAADTGAWVEVGPGFAQAWRAASQMWSETGGAFDPTLGAVASAWGFGPDPAPPERVPPSAGALWIALSRTGPEKVEVRERAGAYEARRTADVALDLSGIAKGQGVDRAVEALAAAGYGDLLLEVGGEIRTLGRPSAQRRWRVGISAPSADLATPARSLAATLLAPDDGLAVATSGDYRNYVEVGGERRPHILDPATGEPLRNRVASVSLAGQFAAMRADALATALAVMGAEAGLEWAAQRELAALYVLRAPADEEDGAQEAGRAEWELRSTPQWGAWAAQPGRQED